MKINKWLKITLIPLVLVAVTAVIVGCSAKTTAASSTQITYTVQKGNVSLNITAVGNLAYSQEQQLSFDTGGTLSEVDVNVGDSVTKGQVLAKLDMTGWQANITSLQEQLAAKNLASANAQQQEKTAEQTVSDKQNAVITAQNTLANVQYALIQAQRNLTQQQLTIASDQLTVKKDQYAFDTNSGGAWAWDNLVIARQQLAIDQAKTDDYNNAITTANNNITAAQWTVQDAQTAVQNAQTAVTLAQAGVTNALQAVTDAQSALDQANATSPEITAPFDGLIIAVNTTAGQTVYKGGTIVTIVDPNQFEANISIGETDIPNVKVNGNATVGFDALPGVMLPGKITSIAPTASTTQGVVSYPVTVNITSLQNMAGQSSQSNSGRQGSASGSQFGSQSSTTGQNSSDSSTFRRSTTSASSSGTTNTTSATSQTVQLKQGLTATVNIIYQSANNVLVVPNQAITTSGNTATVNVLNNGVITKTTVQTGLSNSTLTEVTSGLNEGDKIVYYRAVATTTTTSSNSRTGGGLGGGGAIFRGD
jgi:multidrug efflux pump subunit AcrA (membrane-fusion protein)